MQGFWSATTGSFVKGYYDDSRSVMMFNILVCTISNPKLYQIKVYNLDGGLRETFYYYKKDAKFLIEEWEDSYTLYYDFYESINFDLKNLIFPKLKTKSIESTPRKFNIQLPVRGAISLNNTPRSRLSSPRGAVSLPTTPRTLD